MSPSACSSVFIAKCNQWCQSLHFIAAMVAVCGWVLEQTDEDDKGRRMEWREEFLCISKVKCHSSCEMVQKMKLIPFRTSELGNIIRHLSRFVAVLSCDHFPSTLSDFPTNLNCKNNDDNLIYKLDRSRRKHLY